MWDQPRISLLGLETWVQKAPRAASDFLVHVSQSPLTAERYLQAHGLKTMYKDSKPRQNGKNPEVQTRAAPSIRCWLGSLVHSEIKGLDQNVNNGLWACCVGQWPLLPITTFLRKVKTHGLHSLQVPYTLRADTEFADWLFQAALLSFFDTSWRHGKQQNICSEITDGGGPWYVLDEGKELGKWLRCCIYSSCKTSTKVMLSPRSSLSVLWIGLISDSWCHIWGNPDKTANILIWVCQLCCRILGI